MLRYTTIICFFLNLLCNFEAYKILITLPGVSGSQNLVMFRLAELLGERGNDVTIFTYDVYPDVQRIPLKYSKEITFNVMDDPEMLRTLRGNTLNATWQTLDGDELPFKRFTPFLRSLAKGCDKLLNEKNLLNQLKSKNFDVIIIHYFDFCSFGIAHALGIHGTVFMSTAYMLDPFSWYSGSPNPLSYSVSGLHDTVDRMNFYQRAKNLALGVAFYVGFHYGIEWTFTDVFRKHFGSEFPSLNTLMLNTDLYFINSDPMFEYPRPIMHNVIYIGGFTMKQAEPLTQDWQKIVDESGEHGVVVFSLGSIANTSFMPDEIKNAFYYAFKRIPQKVIWRFEGELPEPKKTSPNIHTVDWLPQKDLLAHPNVKAFITHGGYNSLTEATYIGVPLILFPLFGDQFANCKRVERLRLGVTLKRSELSETTVFEALQTVLYSSEIQTNARQLGRMIRSAPVSAHDLAYKWIEFLAEFQNLDQLKPASQYLNLIQYFLIDVILLISLISLVLIYLLSKLCINCCCRCLKSKVKKE